jgi:hypothetical protein
MRNLILSSLLATGLIGTSAGVAVAQSSMATEPPTIGTVQTMTVSPKDMAALKAATSHYLESALGDEKAFYASLTPDYVGVGISGKTYSPGSVYGAVQVLKQPLAGVVTRVKVIDAHHLGDQFDETALIGGTADTIDSAGPRSVSATWVHKITFKRDADGTLKVQRDQVLQKIM